MGLWQRNELGDGSAPSLQADETFARQLDTGCEGAIRGAWRLIRRRVSRRLDHAVRDLGRNVAEATSVLDDRSVAERQP